ncbi:prepilin peptidase [Pseudarthrobacter phenanthrenivorans]|uniref:Prepilin peptidase n=1 Tax=Pseudarthrobacter phenanthrenivorans TaxID=361575 RepID=A0A3B0G0A5_PSEPS|nr:prepilin peptidase [Pseudarthrobacter phenanthrenivorans]RKO25575.1 prepilin peptidase [Pseudarthrobacter phenanthrenivorans]
MDAVGSEGFAGWLPVFAAGALGTALSLVADILIARLLPRLGRRPSPAVRITTAALTFAFCAGFAVRFGIVPELPAFIFFAVLGIQLARADIALHLLPNPMVLALLGGGLLLLFAPAIFASRTPDLLRAVLGAVILFAAYLILALVSPGGIGMGDVKLAAPIGLYLGYLGWTQLLYGGLLGFLLNGVVTLVVVAIRGRKDTAEVAHGPSMLGATAGIALLLA